MPSTLTDDPVKVWRAAVTRDDYGVDVLDWADKTLVFAGKASVQPVFSYETLPDRQTTTEQLRLISFDPRFQHIEANDRIEWNGRLLEIDSAVQVHRFRMRFHHIEFNLRYVEG